MFNISCLPNGGLEFSPTALQDFGEDHEALHIIREHVKSH